MNIGGQVNCDKVVFKAAELGGDIDSVVNIPKLLCSVYPKNFAATRPNGPPQNHRIW